MSFGQRLSLYPLEDSLAPPVLVRPRPLSLRLYRPARIDSEKNIVVLHEKSLQLLGVAPGDFVRLQVASTNSSEPGAFELRARSFRAYPGLESEVRRGNEFIAYPQVTEIYVDAYGRASLGLGRNDQGTVVLVTANVKRLFLSRSVFYGGTLFLSLAASQTLADFVGVVTALIAAVVITLLVTLFDLRSRVQY